MQGMTKLVSFLICALAVAVSVEIAPDAAEMLLERGNGENEVHIQNVYYSCVNGNSFAIVRSGAPADDAGDHDVAEAMGFRVYVPRSMSFKDGVPRIVTFPRRTGQRDVGVPNVTS